MLTMWHKEAFQCDDHGVGKGFIFVNGKHLKSNTQVSMVNVYASCNLQGKVAFWEELTCIKEVQENITSNVR